MPDNTSPQVPENRDPRKEIAAAAQEAIDKAKKSALSGVTEDDLVWNDPGTDVVKGKQYHSDAWVHSAANIELLASAYKMLMKLSTPPVNKVEKVRVAHVKNTKYIMIRPTSATDPNGIEVKEYNSTAWINAITVIGPAKLTVRTGYRDRFVVESAPDDFPGAPALLLNLGKRVERVYEGKKTTTAATPTTTADTQATKVTKSAKAAAKPADPTAPAPATPDEAQ